MVDSPGSFHVTTFPTTLVGVLLEEKYTAHGGSISTIERFVGRRYQAPEGSCHPFGQTCRRYELKLSGAVLEILVFVMVRLSVARLVIDTGADTTGATVSALILRVISATTPVGVVPAGNRARRVNDPIEPAVTTGVKFTVILLPTTLTPVTGLENTALT